MPFVLCTAPYPMLTGGAVQHPQQDWNGWYLIVCLYCRAEPTAVQGAACVNVCLCAELEQQLSREQHVSMSVCVAELDQYLSRQDLHNSCLFVCLCRRAGAAVVQAAAGTRRMEG